MEISQETFTAEEPYILAIILLGKLSRDTTVSKKHLHIQVHISAEFTIDNNLSALKLMNEKLIQVYNVILLSHKKQ